MTAMVLKHFGLSHAPFQIAPETRFFFSGGKRMAILQALVEGLNQGRGIIEVTGVAGSGKTLMCRMMLERVPAERVLPVYLGDTSLLPNESLKVLARAMGVALPTGDQEAVLSALRQAALNLRQQGREVVVMVDEAQAMPVETFSVLHRLADTSNISNTSDTSDTADGWLFKLVFLGQPELDDLLELPSLFEVQQSIVYKFKLEPLNAEDVARYIAHRMQIAGMVQDLFRPSTHDVFTPAAVVALADISLGVPRRINLFAEKALHAAALENADQVTVDHVLGVGGSATSTTAVTSTEPVAFAPETADSVVHHHLELPDPPNASVVPAGVSIDFQDTALLSDTPQRSSRILQPSTLRKSVPWIFGVLATSVCVMLGVIGWRMQVGYAPQAATVAMVKPVASPTNAELSVPPIPPVARVEPMVAKVMLEEAPPAAGTQVKEKTKEEAPNQQSEKSITAVALASESLKEIAAETSSERTISSSATASHQRAKLTAKIIEERLAAGKQWLENAPAEHGSLQLFVLAARGDDGLRRFLKQHTSPGGKIPGTLEREKIYLYLSTLKGKMRMSVLYGEFATRSAALEAIKGLPAEIRALKPYARSIQGLREEIVESSGNLQAR